MGQGVHLPNFLANPGCQVVALAEARPRLGAAVAAKHGIPRVYFSHRELAADPMAEAVASITSEALHPEIVGDLVAARKHVYIEKPLATTSAEGAALVKGAARSGVTLMVAYMKRYDSGVSWARELLNEHVAAGDLGRITYARAHCFGGNWIGAFRPPLLTTDEPAPSGPRKVPPWLPAELRDAYLTYVNVYCHNINLLRWFLGCEPQVKYAQHHDGVTLAAMDFAGVPAILETGHLPAHRWDESMTIFFERGCLEVLPPPPLHPEPARVMLYRARERHEVIAPLAEWKWSFAAEAEHFVACVAAGSQPLTPGSDALKDLQVCEAVFRRLAEG
jgi:predicted dehydrogenase